jgi:hypothetical protein
MPKRRVVRHEVTQPLNESYRLIPLTQGQTAIVDAEDFEMVSALNWHAHWNPNTQSFYARCWQNGRMMMHKFILGYDAGEQADHKNHNTLDNRRENLRRCTPMQNSQFRKKRSDNTSGFKGVCLHNGKWEAAITVNKKTIRLGSFETPEDAGRAYNEAAKNLFTDFAHINDTIA